KRSTASPAGAPRALPRAGALQRGLGERETVTTALSPTLSRKRERGQKRRATCYLDLVPSITGADRCRSSASLDSQQARQHVLHHRALADHAFDGLAHRQRLGEGVEEVAFATDDLDLRLGQRGGQHLGDRKTVV